MRQDCHINFPSWSGILSVTKKTGYKGGWNRDSRTMASTIHQPSSSKWTAHSWRGSTCRVNCSLKPVHCLQQVA